jgi:hypothetical protein
MWPELDDARTRHEDSLPVCILQFDEPGRHPVCTPGEKFPGTSEQHVSIDDDLLVLLCT